MCTHKAKNRLVDWITTDNSQPKGRENSVFNSQTILSKQQAYTQMKYVRFNTYAKVHSLPTI